jgi:hypothetical protein
MAFWATIEPSIGRFLQARAIINNLAESESE